MFALLPLPLTIRLDSPWCMLLTLPSKQRQFVDIRGEDAVRFGTSDRPLDSTDNGRGVHIFSSEELPGSESADPSHRGLE